MEKNQNPFSPVKDKEKYDIYRETEILYKDEEQLLTRKRVGEILVLSDSTVRRKEESGELKRIKRGKSSQSGVLIYKWSVIRLITEWEVDEEIT